MTLSRCSPFSRLSWRGGRSKGSAGVVHRSPGGDCGRLVSGWIGVEAGPAQRCSATRPTRTAHQHGRLCSDSVGKSTLCTSRAIVPEVHTEDVRTVPAGLGRQSLGSHKRHRLRRFREAPPEPSELLRDSQVGRSGTPPGRLAVPDLSKLTLATAAGMLALPQRHYARATDIAVSFKHGRVDYIGP